MRRRNRAETGETPKELVMWIVVSCGNRERRRAELDFSSRESFDDFHRCCALGAKPNLARTRFTSDKSEGANLLKLSGEPGRTRTHSPLLKSEI
jgi:hypothetical protein